MVRNGGRALTPLYCDEYLLERLRLLVTEPSTPKRVKAHAQAMYAGWAEDLRGRRECERLVALHKQVPLKTRKPRPQPKYLSNDPRDLEEDYNDDEAERDARRGGYNAYSDPRNQGNDEDSDDDDNSDRDQRGGQGSSSSRHPPPVPSSSSKPRAAALPKKKQKARQALPQINLATERPKIQRVLAESGTAATDLSNALKLINWERELSTDNRHATECFNKCRALRKAVLRYIHSIESEEFIGSLIHANDELVAALKQYDEMSRPPDYDSDSDGEDSDYENDDWKVESDRMAKLQVGEGSSRRNDDDDDEEDPFGDSHAI